MSRRTSVIKFSASLLMCVMMFLPTTLFAKDKTKLTDRPDVQAFINHVAKQYKFDPAYLTKIFDQAKFLPKVIAQGKHPYEAKPWAHYQAFFITPDRIHEGVQFYNKHQKILAMAEQKYGVPANILAAIIGVETRYGKKMGDYRVIDTLTTLAFTPGPRSEFFKRELEKYLELTKVYHLNPLKVYGSRSGAMGLCQFMPSNYLRYGVNYQKDDKPANIFSNYNDAILSTANFLMQHGWERNRVIATPAKITGWRFNSVAKLDSRKPQQPQMSLAQFKAHGITPAGALNPKDLAYFMILDGQSGPEYWLGLQNFYVITRYNNSDLYAMAVYQFGNAIESSVQQKAARKAQVLGADSQIQRRAVNTRHLERTADAARISGATLRGVA
ncbi:MAG: lytic murein transglycosylase B [Gammaproteobacteria bacterium]